jgi:hypothetical protein
MDLAWAVNPGSNMAAVNATRARGLIRFVIMLVRRNLTVEDSFIGSVFFGFC